MADWAAGTRFPGCFRLPHSFIHGGRSTRNSWGPKEQEDNNQESEGSIAGQWPHLIARKQCSCERRCSQREKRQEIVTDSSCKGRAPCHCRRVSPRVCYLLFVRGSGSTMQNYGQKEVQRLDYIILQAAVESVTNWFCITDFNRSVSLPVLRNLNPSFLV